MPVGVLREALSSMLSYFGGEDHHSHVSETSHDHHSVTHDSVHQHVSFLDNETSIAVQKTQQMGNDFLGSVPHGAKVNTSF